MRETATGVQRHRGKAGEKALLCLVPPGLGRKLVSSLRRHYDDAGIEIEAIEERRSGERRSGSERRRRDDGPPAETAERRVIRNQDGRRIAERRAAVIPVEAPGDLPRRARPYAEQITFQERAPVGAEQLEDIDTARLITRIQAGEDLFTELYERYFDRVYGYLLVALEAHHEAEDGAQQVFLKTLEALPRYERRRQPFRAWLFRIARNHAVDQLRRHGRIEVADPEEMWQRRDDDAVDDGEIPVLNWISDRELLMFIRRLPLAQRQAVMLRYTADLSVDQIAEILERTPEDVRVLTSRGLRFLRQRLNAVGRGSKTRGRSRIRGRIREAGVLRSRRWALSP